MQRLASQHGKGRPAVVAKSPVVLGTLLGAIFGVWDILVTAVDPLANDTPAALLMFYGPMFTAWGLAGFAATWRSGQAVQGAKTGGTIAFVTFVVFSIANLARVNLFLNAIRDRADWQNMVVRFQTSVFESFRAFVNYVYLSGAPFKMLVASAIGTVTGLMGGALWRVFHRRSNDASLVKGIRGQ